MDGRWKILCRFCQCCPNRGIRAHQLLSGKVMCLCTAAFFAWHAFQDRCLTADVLARKGCPRNETSALCLSAPETAQHLLGDCTMTLQLWCRILPIAQLPSCSSRNQINSSSIGHQYVAKAQAKRLELAHATLSGGPCGKKGMHVSLTAQL
jgi:hypothetical protein